MRAGEREPSVCMGFWQLKPTDLGISVVMLSADVICTSKLVRQCMQCSRPVAGPGRQEEQPRVVVYLSQPDQNTRKIEQHQGELLEVWHEHFS